MLDELERSVVRDPKVLFPGKRSEGLQFFAADVQARDTFYQGKVLGAQGHGDSIQFSAE
jgi:hypothetical protein